MMRTAHRAALESALGEVASATATVARFCDYSEHVEPTDVSAIAEAAAVLRSAALKLADDLAVDAVALYGERLDIVERRYVLGIVGGFEGGAHVELAETWRDLQLIQGHHDRLYRPDVSGLSRADQLRHVCIHLAKLVGALAQPDLDVVRTKVIPDVLLFGLKLSTIIGQELKSSPVPRRLVRGRQ
jgi:hypothetical protein